MKHYCIHLVDAHGNNYWINDHYSLTREKSQRHSWHYKKDAMRVAKHLDPNVLTGMYTPVVEQD